MIELIKKDRSKVKPMNLMQPLEVGVIVETGHVVMRTASSHSFEVMDLSDLGEDQCYRNMGCDPLVRELHQGEEYILRLFKKE